MAAYQVCEKWLKDRKARRLSDEEITHYIKIIGALVETARLMREIDAVIEAVIEGHGGRSNIFQTLATRGY